MNHTVLFDFHDLSSMIVGDFVTRKNMWLYVAYVFNLFPYTRTVYRFWYGVLGMDIYIDVSCDNVDNTLQLFKHLTSKVNTWDFYCYVNDFHLIGC